MVPPTRWVPSGSSCAALKPDGQECSVHNAMVVFLRPMSSARIADYVVPDLGLFRDCRKRPVPWQSDLQNTLV